MCFYLPYFKNDWFVVLIAHCQDKGDKQFIIFILYTLINNWFAVTPENHYVYGSKEGR